MTLKKYQRLFVKYFNNSIMGGSKNSVFETAGRPAGLIKGAIAPFTLERPGYWDCPYIKLCIPGKFCGIQFSDIKLYFTDEMIVIDI